MRRLIPISAVLFPLATAVLFSILITTGLLGERVLIGSYDITLSSLIFVLGIFLSSLCLFGVSLYQAHKKRLIRAQRRAEVQVSESRRRFFQRLDHELKNPLTIIRLGIVNVGQSATLSPDESASLVRVADQVQRLQKLIVDLRWLADIEESNVEHSQVILAEVLEEAVAMVKGMPEYHQRSLDLSIQQVPWPLGEVSGDRDLLAVAFRNLLNNALKYTDSDGRVEVRATDDGNAITIEIADNGPGIPESDMPHIFEELYRGRDARSKPGSGLGLALVQRIILLHNGQVRFRSKLGQGTIAIVHLPLRQG